MKRDANVHVSWAMLVAAAVALLATGAGATYVGMRSADARRLDGPGSLGSSGAAVSSPAPALAATPAFVPEPIVTLTTAAMARAGLTVGRVTTGGGTRDLRLPGIVEPNGYRQVTVTPLTAGRVTRVLVEQGQRVRKGQPMAEVFSPDLAEARTKYVSARAELVAHQLELARTQKLVEIGAASRQELERIHAAHTAQTAVVQSGRSRLELLGLASAVLDGATPEKVGSAITVAAPMAGVVTERLANVGVNVDPSTRLFVVVDLSTVWVVADVYEKDVPRVRVGQPATATTAADPDRVLQGRVSYIDTQLDASTRTAKARVELENAGGALRFGMYADVVVPGTAVGSVLSIPRSAVQDVGNRQVVYLADATQPGMFTERSVQLGSVSGEQVEVLSGLNEGDAIVTSGSFFVRAEKERLGLRSPADVTTASPAAAAAPVQKTDVQTARVVVNDRGFEPSRLQLRAGVPARVTFVRNSEKTCATEVTFPSLKIKRALPMNEPSVIEFTPAKGELAFACGMNMLTGSIVVD